MLLSRVADALYWISRYLERAEHTARLIDVRLDLGLDRPAGCARAGISSGSTRAFSCRRRRRPPASPAALIDALVFDLSNRDSVASCVTAARENARQVREEISSDMWEQINALFLRLKQAKPKGRGRRGRTTSRAWSSTACTSSRASPTRRWATAKGGSTCRSGASSSAPARRRRWSICISAHGSMLPAEPRRVGRPAAVVLGARRRIAAATRPTSGPSGSPSSCS